MFTLTVPLITLTIAATAAPTPPPAPTPPAAERRAALEIFRELVEIDTTHDHGSTAPAAEAIAKRLRAAGVPDGDIRILGPSPTKQNLVARLHGSGRRPPLLLLGHLDVVEARRSDWTVEPFHLTERDGYYYGRGTADMKSLDAYWVAHFLRLHREKRALDRDVILALTADEEAGDENGIEWLLAHAPDLIRAAYALNEGGGGELKSGRRRANDVQASEKGYFSFRLEVRNKGGHSSLPERDNAIVRLGRALIAVHDYEFDARLTPVTRAYFARLAGLESRGAKPAAPPKPIPSGTDTRPSPPRRSADLAAGASEPSQGSGSDITVAADLQALASTEAGKPLDPAAVTRLSLRPFYNARLRTTCVPTRVQGGHADNALPQLATAVVNCRLLPGDSADDVRGALERAIGDDAVSIAPMGRVDTGPDSPLLPELFQAVTAVTVRLWPGVVVLPVMSTGATDGRFLRAAGIPTYGVSGLFGDIDDVRAHGRDERVGVQAFYEGLEFTWELLGALTSNARN